MSTLAAVATAWLGTFLLHATLLLAAALLVGTRLRATWLRERVLRLGFFGAFLTATLATAGIGSFGGRIPLDLEPADERPALVEGPGSSAPLPLSRTAREASAARRTSPAATLLPPPTSPVRLDPPAARAASPVPAAGTSPALAPSGEGAGLSLAHLATLALALWLAWCAIGLAGLARTFLRLRRTLRGRSTLEGPLARELASLRRRAGVWAPVRLSVSDDVPVPLTLGLVRHEICLPRRALAAFTPTELRSILAHELAHTKRRDTLWFLGYALVERAFAFHPLFRRARRELQATAELECDDLAVRWSGAGLELASSLTEIARWLVAAGGPPVGVPTMAPAASRLSRRVMRLLEADAGERRERRLLAAGSTLVSLAAVSFFAPGLEAQLAPARELSPGRAPESEEPDEAAERDRPGTVADERGTRTPSRPGDPSGRPAPAALFAAAAPAPVAGAVPFGLQLDRELLAGELELFEAEIDGLRAELAGRAPERLAEALDGLERRLATLRRQGERMDQLLERVFEEPQTDVGGAPRADVPTESP